jgi:hypothetical protein
MSQLRSAGVEKEQQRLLRHVVLFRWKEGTPAEKVGEIERTFCELPSKIEQIHTFEWGTDVSVEGKSKGMSHCFLVTFASAEDRDIYLPHPAHEAFSTLAKPHVADVLVLDYWCEA